MSKEFIAAEMALFMEQCKEVDIVITTVCSSMSCPISMLSDVHIIPGLNTRTTCSETHNERNGGGNETRLCHS